MSDCSSDEGTSKFEIMVAILLGIAAIGSAWASYQSSLWGGNQATAYSESAMIATNAATMKTEAFVDIASDFAIDIQAKKLIAEARRSPSPMNLEMASYLYQFQLSEPGFRAFGFPAEYAFEDQDETVPAAATPPAATGEPEDVEDETDEPAAAAAPRLGASALPQIPTDLLIASLESDLDDDEGYYQAHLGEGIAEERKARTRFLEGQEYNKTGDKYSLVGVILTIALFFAGISLVFRSNARWKLFSMGVVVFVIGILYMLTLPLA